jgi:hypothetical protein
MMFEFTGYIKDLVFDYFSGKTLLTFAINEHENARECYDQLKEPGDLVIRVDKRRKKRSLNANNYAWHLMNEIGNVLRENKEDIYQKMLRRYGQRMAISVRADVPIDTYIKYYEEFGEGTVNGKLFKHYYVFKGSSEYDTKEMSVFIDGIVDEAKHLGIQTETPETIAKMKSLWEVDMK